MVGTECTSSGLSDQEVFYSGERSEWRKWLSENFDRKDGVWFVFPLKGAGEPSIPYNDAVEEALCFGWIDSTIKHLDPLHRIQHFTPRRKGSSYSRPNIERLIRMESKGLVHPFVREHVLTIINQPFVFPEDIMERIRSDEEAWMYYCTLPGGYRRIRIAYIDAARKRPEEFERRLESFISKTRAGKIIRGFGGIDEYYDIP